MSPFDKELLETLTDIVSARLVTVHDLHQRKHPILAHYKVGDSRELVQALSHCLFALSDADKIKLIDTLSKTVSLTDS